MTTAFSLDARLKLMPKLEGDGFLHAPIVSTAFALADGSGDGQANAMFHKEITVASDSSTTIDLTALAVNALGLSGSLYFWKVRFFYIANASQLASVTVFDAEEFAPRWQALYTESIVLRPGGALLALDREGYVVNGGSKTIKISNYETVYEFTGTLLNNSKTVSDVADTSSLLVGMEVSGSGIPAGATITAKTASTLILSAEATATSEDEDLTATKPPAVVVVSLAGVLD